MARRSLVIGNWKLNGSKEGNYQLVEQLKQKLANVNNCDIAIAPPVIYLSDLQKQLQGTNIKLAAQNVDVNQLGAFTGEIAAGMLKEFGVQYIIIGHSECRSYHHESNELIAHKFSIIKQTGLTPVLCIGESKSENEAGLTRMVCTNQIDAVLDALGVQAFENAVIAYEPIWAIGTGKSATPEQAQEVHYSIREHIARRDRAIAEQVILQYGGSVTENNANQLFSMPDIDGALVGGASLKADAFELIAKAAANN